MSDLDKTDLPIVTSSNSLQKLFADETSPLMRSLNKKYKIYNQTKPMTRTAIERDICSVERLSDIHVIILVSLINRPQQNIINKLLEFQTGFTRNDGSRMVHVVDECPGHFYLSYIVRKGWPLLSRFSQVLIKFGESGKPTRISIEYELNDSDFVTGLLTLWDEQSERAFVLNHLIHNPPEVQQLQAYSLHDIQTAFYCWCFGLALCVIIFFFEVVVLPPKRRCKKKK